MIRGIVFFTLCTLTFKLFAWGVTGHRVVGLIAENHLTKKAKKNIRRVLDNESLAEVSNFMDFIKADKTYKHMSPWHYATIPDGQTYAEPPEKGDAIQTIKRLVRELKAKNFTDEDQAFALKCLVHLIGDIHQPLHVGNGIDHGGNDLKLQYFRRKTNLHSIWDSGIINSQKYSYTEYAAWLDHPSSADLMAWSSTDVMDWIRESMKFRDQCYQTLNDKDRLSYQYDFDNIELVNKRLLQAGIRLANVLNEIYG